MGCNKYFLLFYFEKGLKGTKIHTFIHVHSIMFISGARRRSLSGLTENTEITTSKNCLEATPAPPSNSKLVFSGGEGYVDFRIGVYQGQYLKMETCLKQIPF